MKKREQALSTLMDDEADSLSQASTLKHLLNEEPLQKKMQRYELIRDALKNQLPQTLNTKEIERIKQAINKQNVNYSRMKYWKRNIIIFIIVVIIGVFMFVPKLMNLHLPG